MQPVVSGINHNEFLAQLKVPQCRKDCMDKVSLIQCIPIFDLISFILLFITLFYMKKKNQTSKLENTRSYLSKQWTITME